MRVRMLLRFAIPITVAIILTVVAGFYFRNHTEDQVRWCATENWPPNIREATHEFSLLAPEKRMKQAVILRDFLGRGSQQLSQDTGACALTQIFYVKDIKRLMGVPCYDAGSMYLAYEVCFDDESQLAWSLVFHFTEGSLFSEGSLISVGEGPGLRQPGGLLETPSEDGGNPRKAPHLTPHRPATTATE